MSDHQQIQCSFCNRNKQDTEILIAGANAHICNSCIEQAFQIVEQDSKSTISKSFDSNSFNLLKPLEIKSKYKTSLALLYIVQNSSRGYHYHNASKCTYAQRPKDALFQK